MNGLQSTMRIALIVGNIAMGKPGIYGQEGMMVNNSYLCVNCHETYSSDSGFHPEGGGIACPKCQCGSYLLVDELIECWEVRSFLKGYCPKTAKELLRISQETSTNLDIFTKIDAWRKNATDKLADEISIKKRIKKAMKKDLENL